MLLLFALLLSLLLVTLCFVLCVRLSPRLLWVGDCYVVGVGVVVVGWC